MRKRSDIIREAKLFDWVVQYIWPILRFFVRRNISDRCRLCGISENCSPLTGGKCSECAENRTKRLGIEAERLLNFQARLDQLIQSSKNKGRYDALVLFSGGKDSTYMILRLKETYPDLRVLALTVDNTFMSPVAMENIQRCVEELGFEHMIYRPENRFMEKMFRHAFKDSSRGCSQTVDQCDGEFFCDVARNIARDLKTPMIFCGLSPEQVERIFHLRNFETFLENEKAPRTSVAGFPLDEIFSDEELKHWWPGGEVRHHFIFPYYAWGYDEATVRAEVIRHALFPKRDVSPIVTNHELIPLMGLVDMARFGYSSFEAEMCSLVRKAAAPRKFWTYAFELLEFSAKTGFLISGSLDGVLSRLGLNRGDLNLK